MKKIDEKKFDEKCEFAVSFLSRLFGECDTEVFADAFQEYAFHSDYFGMDHDATVCYCMCKAFDKAGYNHRKKEFDVLKKYPSLYDYLVFVCGVDDADIESRLLDGWYYPHHEIVSVGFNSITYRISLHKEKR